MCLCWVQTNPGTASRTWWGKRRQEWNSHNICSSKTQPYNTVWYIFKEMQAQLWPKSQQWATMSLLPAATSSSAKQLPSCCICPSLESIHAVETEGHSVQFRVQKTISVCLHACGKVSVTMVTAGQEPSYQRRAKWSQHVSHVFTQILCLLSTCLVSNGQFKLIFFPQPFCLIINVYFRKCPDW